MLGSRYRSIAAPWSAVAARFILNTGALAAPLLALWVIIIVAALPGR